VRVTIGRHGVFTPEPARDVNAGYIITDVERLRRPMQQITDHILALVSRATPPDSPAIARGIAFRCEICPRPQPQCVLDQPLDPACELQPQVWRNHPGRGGGRGRGRLHPPGDFQEKKDERFLACG